MMPEVGESGAGVTSSVRVGGLGSIGVSASRRRAKEVSAQVQVSMPRSDGWLSSHRLGVTAAAAHLFDHSSAFSWYPCPGSACSQLR